MFYQASFRLASAATIALLASAAFATDFPYPYPYEGPNVSNAISMSWALGDANKTFTYEIPAPDIRSGELTKTTIAWNIPYSANFSGTLADGFLARVQDDWLINLPEYGIVGGPLLGEVHATCGSCLPGTSFGWNPLNAGPLQGTTERFPSTTFDMHHPQDYQPAGVSRPDSPLNHVAGNLFLIRSRETAPNVATYQQNHLASPITVTQEFRPWTVEEILSTRLLVTTIGPTIRVNLNQVRPLDDTRDVGPLNFGFTLKEAAEVGDFDNFNWIQKPVAWFEPQPGFETPLRQDRKLAEISRGTVVVGGTDPGTVHPNDILDPDPDFFAPYWDQFSIPGREDFFYDSPHNHLGSYFSDRLDLGAPGRQIFFETTMGGWDNAVADPAQRFKPFVDEQFTVKWGFRQIRQHDGETSIRLQSVGSDEYYGVAMQFGTGAWTEAAIASAAETLAAYEPTPGDVNFDGVVDGEDFLIWQRTFASTTNFSADLNQDGQVDQLDLDVILANFGAGSEQVANVPEPAPSTMLLACAAAVMLTAPRKRSLVQDCKRKFNPSYECRPKSVHFSK